jgi:hypothetical protein
MEKKLFGTTATPTAAAGKDAVDREQSLFDAAGADFG